MRGPREGAYPQRTRPTEGDAMTRCAAPQDWVALARWSRGAGLLLGHRPLRVCISRRARPASSNARPAKCGLKHCTYTHLSAIVHRGQAGRRSPSPLPSPRGEGDHSCASLDSCILVVRFTLSYLRIPSGTGSGLLGWPQSGRAVRLSLGERVRVRGNRPSRWLRTFRFAQMRARYRLKHPHSRRFALPDAFVPGSFRASSASQAG